MTEYAEDRLSPEIVKANTEVVDITEDPGWLAAARWEVAVGYSKLAVPNRKLRMRDIYKSICEDGYERGNRSRTLAAMTVDPASGSKEIAGTVRLVLGQPQQDASAMPPIDAMNFITLKSGWPHRRHGKSDAEIAELGRFVIAERYRTPAMRAADTDAFIAGSLMTAAERLAKARGASVMYALMPARVAEISARAGVGLTEVPIGLRTDDPQAAKVFDAFSLYWKHSPPRLYVMRASGAPIAALFATALEPGSVIDDPQTIEQRFARNVTALERHIPLVLRPASETEVSRIVAIANEHRVALYPYSTGKNWGLGSKLPVIDDCVVVDLSRMSRIVEVNEEFGYAILEPGVTQIQLASYLNQHHPSLTLNFTGSFAHTGIVGNVLERGDGAHARVDDLLGVRGVFGSGQPFAAGGFWDRVGTGFPSHVQRYTAGPDLVGLLCQSNFGIVTQLAFKLIHKPELRCVLWGTVSDERLEALVDLIDGFARQGAINRGSVNIGYANRFVQGQRSMTDASPAVAPPEDWNFYILIGGTVGATETLSQEIAGALSTLCTERGKFRLGQRPGDHDPAEKLPAFLQPLLSPLLGVPDASSIKLIYEATGTPLPGDDRDIDTDQTPFGMKCNIAVVPPRGRYVRQASDIAADVRRESGLNVKASFFGDGRTLITVHFRTDDPAQVARAEACEEALWEAMIAAGFPPYRVSINQMHSLVALQPEYFDLVAQLKSTLDPNGIISPGRYCPTPNHRPPGGIVHGS